MKKFLALIVLIFLSVGILVGCGSSDEEMEFEPLEWPTYENAKQIPIPKSNMADTRNINDVRFDFYLANTTFDDYKDYVEQCKDKGFTVDVVEQETSYHAFNQGNYELSVRYQDGDIMYVCIVEERYDVEIKLLHTNNTSASMYDLWIEIDGYWEEDSDQGYEVISFDSYLKEGKHTLRIENGDDRDVNGRIDFIVSQNGEYFEFEITCLDNKIDIKQTNDTSQEIENNNGKVESEVFLAALEQAVLQRVETISQIDYDRTSAVNAELIHIKQYNDKVFTDDQLQALALKYINGLNIQLEASYAEHDYENPIDWYQGIVACYDVLNELYQKYGFLKDNSDFIETYISQYEEQKAILLAYQSIDSDLSGQVSDDMSSNYDGTNLSFEFQNNTGYAFSTLWQITYYDTEETVVGIETAVVEDIPAGQQYTVSFYVPYPNVTDHYNITGYYTEVQLPHEETEGLFVAKGETRLMAFLEAAENNGYEIINPERDGSYVNAKARSSENTFSIRYMVENQQVYMVEVELFYDGTGFYEYKACIVAMAKALNPHIESSVLNAAIDEAFATPKIRVIESETLFIFDDSKAVFTITH